MRTLRVENVPDELYEALRARARTRRKSISAEMIELLQENVPTAAELARRKQLLKLAIGISGQRPSAPRRFPSAEEMLHEDRLR
jgi:plasmid stability protein